jgi:hypothetical protein
MSTKVKLKNVRIAFIDSLIGAAKDYQDNGRFRHSATFLVAPGSENDKAIEAAFKTEAAAMWPKKAQAMIDEFKPQGNKCCYQKGDTKEYDGFEGMMVLAGHRQVKDGRPMLFDNVGYVDPEDGKTKPKKLMGSDGKFYPGKEGRIYAGSYVNATVEIYAQGAPNPGLRCGLIAVQYHGEGDSFGGASKPKDEDFEVIDAPEMAEDDIS